MSFNHDTSWRLCGNNWLLTKKSPPDGNCLYTALLDQMNHSNLSLPNCWSPRDLRLTIVDHIASSIPQYYNQILSNIVDAKGKVSHDPTAILDFIRNQRKDHVWGGAESIAAISSLLNTRVAIYTVEGHEFSIGPTNSNRSLKLLYSAIDGLQRNHYDSIRALHRIIMPCSANDNPTIPLSSTDPLSRLYIPDQAPETLNIPSLKPNTKFLKLGTWNIRGASDINKRRGISSALLGNNIIVAGIQETHLSTGQYSDSNYIWHLSGGKESTNNPRGVAILINKEANIEVLVFSPHSENLASATLVINGISLNLITCHIPCEGSNQSTEVIAQLNLIIDSLKANNSPTIIVGDLNAHIGYEDLSPLESLYIGRTLKHRSSNNNGILIKNTIVLHSLALNTSKRANKSVLTTWTNGTAESQLDHILSTNCVGTVRMECNAIWDKTVPTDHKLVIVRLEPLKHKPKQASLRKKSWNIERLRDKVDGTNYKDLIKLSLEQCSEPQHGTKDEITTWENLSKIITDSATTTLNTPCSPMTPKRRLAMANLQKAKFRNAKFHSQPDAQLNLKAALAQRRSSFEEHSLDKCKTFFKEISTFHPKIRTKLLYKFTKQHKNQHTPKNKFIPMSKWENTMISNIPVPSLNLLREDPHIPPIPPPTPDEINCIIQKYRKGASPGIDRINVELLQEGPPELRVSLALILARAWSTNIIPEDWTLTLQSPIPKVPCPKSTEDYRRITLCNIAYKVYAKHLLNKLDESIPPIPQYQAAFLANRSTDDHIFTTRRIMEEAWREGRTLYLLTLDLAKAFDSVDHKALIAILKRQEVPTFLINRIITACLYEKSAIQWFGQTSKFFLKQKGVKQGCPISPRLFTLVLHEIIVTTTEVLPKFSLGNSGHISLPTILAYADDLIIIADNVMDLEECLKELEPNLLSTGLELNPNKCELLIRDPYQVEQPLSLNSSLSINKIPIKIVNSIKYLGSQLTEHLNRRGTIKPRMDKAIKSARMLIPFLKQYKLPWSSIRSLYNTMIIPVATFGLKATALTTANRNSLKNMEKLILSLLAQQCRVIPSNKITTLLKGKTIWRKLMCHRIRYWAHIQRRPPTNILQAAARIRALSKKVGRPCTTWHDTLERDFTRSGIPKSSWEVLANDRVELKKATANIFKLENSSDEDEIYNL